jgi:hypothetical protein
MAARGLQDGTQAPLFAARINADVRGFPRTITALSAGICGKAFCSNASATCMKASPN